MKTGLSLDFVFNAARHSKPDTKTLKAFETRKTKHPNWVRADETVSALTGWDGRTLDTENIQIAPGYAEPGYQDPETAILFADWNSCSRRVQDILEQMGYALEWDDEWTTCYSCGKALRTSPDSYSWQASYSEGDCEITCLDCTDPADHLAGLENNPNTANTISRIDPADHGYTKVNDQLTRKGYAGSYRSDDSFESGFNGSDGEPTQIYKDLIAKGYDRILFNISGVGQFDTAFDVYAAVVPEPVAA